MLSLDVLSRFGNMVVIGAGTMGGYYVKNLIALGKHPDRISVFDRRPEAALACAAQYPGIHVLPTLEEAIQKARFAGLLFNCTNTSQHAAVLVAAADAGCKYIFSEKPVVLEKDLPMIDGRFNSSVVGCGYLINFSKAVAELMRYIWDNGLHIVEYVSQWGKNRTLEKPRATVGTLEDEATHPLALALRLFGTPSPTSIRVRANFSRVPYVNEEAQQSAMTGDPEYDVDPPSTANVWMELQGPAQRFNAFVTSSYIHDQNVRAVWVKLADGNGRLHSCVRLEFDTPDKTDVFTVNRYHEKAQPVVKTFPSGDKLLDQIAAFMKYAGTEPSDEHLDPRTVLLEEAIRMVRISSAAINDDFTQYGVQV